MTFLFLRRDWDQAPISTFCLPGCAEASARKEEVAVAEATRWKTIDAMALGLASGAVGGLGCFRRGGGEEHAGNITCGRVVFA